MQSSPPHGEGKARAIRELSRSLSHSPRPIPSLSPAPSDSNPTQHFGTDTSNFFKDESILMSTQHQIEEDTNALPRYPQIRSTAKKINTWQMLRSEQPIPDTSMVNKQFGDFDHSLSDEEEMSIEQARGGQRSNRSTPGKHNSSLGGFNSLYDMTPPSIRARKLHAAETGSLRRDAQIRRASRNDKDTAAPRHTSARNSPAQTKHERKRTTLTQSHAKVSEDESSLVEERPPTVTLQSKSTRWGNRSRQPSLQMDGIVEAASRVGANPRSRPATAQNATAQSFMLPDIPNLTELVSGTYEDGAPLFSKTTPARSRFASHKSSRVGGQANHFSVDSVPIPDEEKAIFMSLQLVRERVIQLEHERADAEKKIEEQDMEIISLRATAAAQDNLRRSDSALGSTDGEESGRNSWKIEKTRLEASVQTLRSRLDRAERRLKVDEIEKKRSESERHNFATRLGVASQSFEELKMEKEALGEENHALRQEIDGLRAENDTLRDRLQQQQETYREETVHLRRQADHVGHATQKENETLRTELARVRAQHDENAQYLARNDREQRKARNEQVEYARLKADNAALKSQMEDLRAKLEIDQQRWSSREADLKGRVNRRDETIRHFQDSTQEQTNEAMRIHNNNLRLELQQLADQHREEERRWAKEEEQLRRKVDAARERGLTHGQEDITSGLQRKSSQRREDTRTRIANRVQEEVRNSKLANTSYYSGHIERSPRKSQKNVPSTTSRASLPAYFPRSVSAPVPGHAMAESDVESTTDLSLAPRGTPYIMRGAASGKLSSTIRPPSPMDETELSDFGTEQIAQVRRQVEQERARASGRAVSVPLDRYTREDTARSIASAKSNRPQSLPRKSSMKDITERTTGTEFEDLTGRVSHHEAATAEPTETQQSNIDMSMLSNTSRRRRSAPLENMTSAFIVPDIKMQGREQTTKIDLAEKRHNRAHDNDNCTVCRRQGSSATIQPFHVPKLVPVSTRMPDDVDATLRPSRPPKEALALVVKELTDERAHLHMELTALQAALEVFDVSLGMKKRNQLNEDIERCLHLIEIKDTQIYHLYDVVEGQRDHDITEQQVEEITRQIEVQDEKSMLAKKGSKKVTIQSYIDSEDGNEHESRLSGDEEELPWEGFEDTGSHSVNFGRLDTSVRRRSSVY